MLEHYFIKPSTVDRIRANAAGPYIERYVEWMLSQGYADRNVLRRVPMCCRRPKTDPPQATVPTEN